MTLEEITTAAGAHKRRMRVGRGESSGKGKTCGRGNKGCQSRSGGGVRPLSEGGQMPIFRRLPKRGFTNANFRTDYQAVNLSDLEARFENGATADLDAMKKTRLIQGSDPLVKVLATGTLTKKLTVAAHAFSAKAKEAIEKAGGVAKVIERVNRAAAWRAKRRTVCLKKKGGAVAAKAAKPAAKPDSES